jgi:hypothetical protein
LIPEIRDAGKARVLHQDVSKVFREPFSKKNREDCDGEQGSDTVNPRGEKRVQINSLMSEGVFDKEEPIIGGAWIQDAIHNGNEHQRDQTFRQPDNGKADHARCQPYFVRHDVAQQPAEFFPLIQ